VSFAAGAVPFSGIAAKLISGVDLRQRGSGTVSGSGLYEVAGFGPLVIAGSLDVVKGASVRRGRDRTMVATMRSRALRSVLAGRRGLALPPANSNMTCTPTARPAHAAA
jgi:hypothetical protein